MSEATVLGQVALCYSPIVDPLRSVAALRLTVFPARADSAPDGAALLQALEGVWPSGAVPGAATTAAAVRPHPQVSLNITHEGLLRSLLEARPGPHLMVEVPAFMAGDADLAPALRRLHAAGTTLALKGRAVAPLPPEVLACFSQCILAAGEDRREMLPAAPSGRAIRSLQAGVHDSVSMEAALKRGNAAVIGWPWEDPLPAAGAKATVPQDIGAVMDLINGVDREEPVAKLEPVLRRDPTLAFRLMRYLNSPAFGLPVEVNSFGHALMLLGYQRLKRWLALLLVSSSKAPNSQVLVFAAVRRGLLMEELGRDHADAETRGEMFICGVFSLLHRLLQQPMAELLKSVPVPERVQQALRGEGGPFGAHLELLQAIESESIIDLRERCETLMLGPDDVNRAVLAALKAAREL